MDLNSLFQSIETVTDNRYRENPDPNYEHWFRYFGYVQYYSAGPLVTIELTKLRVVRHTSAGAIILCDDGRERFCLRGAGKRYAHDTREYAWWYFLRRTYSSIHKFQTAKEKAELIMETGNKWGTFPT